MRRSSIAFGRRQLITLGGFSTWIVSREDLILFSMFEAARALVLASFPPGLSDIEVKRRLCERFYGDEVDVEAFVEHLRSR